MSTCENCKDFANGIVEGDASTRMQFEILLKPVGLYWGVDTLPERASCRACGSAYKFKDANGNQSYWRADN